MNQHSIQQATKTLVRPASANRARVFKATLIAISVAALVACGGGGGGGDGGTNGSVPTASTGSSTPITINVGQTYQTSLPSRSANGNTLSYKLKGAVAGTSLSDTGSLVFDATNDAYAALATGQQQTVLVSFVVVDSRGASADGSFTFIVVGQGVQSTPLASSFNVIRGASLAGSLPTRSGAGKSLTYTVTGTAPAGFTLSKEGAYSFDSGVSDYSGVGSGQKRDLAVAFSFTDGKNNGTGSIAITIIGRDAIAQFSSAFTVAEGTKTSGALPPSSVDGKSLTYSLLTGVPGLTLTPSGAYVFDSGNSAYKPLNDGQSQTVEAFVQATDGAAVQTGSLKVTVAGKTDISTPLNTVAAITEGQTANGALATTSALGESLTYTLTGGLAVPGLVLSSNGQYSINTAAPEYANIPTGKVQRFTAYYVVSTVSGAQANGQVNFDITGVDGAPTGTVNLTVEEGRLASGTLPSRSSAGRTITYGVRGALPEGMTVNADGTYSFDARVAGYRSLNSGETRTVVAYLTATEGSATSDVSIAATVLGVTNIPTGVVNSFSVAEGAVLRDNLPMRSADNLPLTYTLVAGSVVAGFDLSSSGLWIFDTNRSDYTPLNDGQKQVVKAYYRVNDTAGSTAEGAFEFTVMGRTNITSTRSSDVTVTEGNQTTGQLGATSGLGSNLRFQQVGTAVPGLTLGSDGAYTFDAGNTAYVPLLSGQTQTVTANYQISDNAGAVVNDSIRFVVKGVSASAPTVPPSISVQEGGITTGDLPAGYSYTISGAAPSGFSVTPQGAYTLDASSGYRQLAAGQSFSQNVVVISSGNGQTFSNTIALTVQGQNSAPSANDYQDAFTALGGIRAGTLKFSATDPENDPLTFSIDPTIPTTAYPPGFALDPSGSYTVDTNNAAYSNKNNYGPYNLTYIVKDPGGLQVKARLTITINPPAGTN